MALAVTGGAVEEAKIVYSGFITVRSPQKLIIFTKHNSINCMKISQLKTELILKIKSLGRRHRV